MDVFPAETGFLEKSQLYLVNIKIGTHEIIIYTKVEPVTTLSNVKRFQVEVVIRQVVRMDSNPKIA